MKKRAISCLITILMFWGMISNISYYAEAYPNVEISYANGTDYFINGETEFYINKNDKDMLYKQVLSKEVKEKVLDEHIICMVNYGKYLYLLAYSEGKSALFKLDMETDICTNEKEFDVLVSKMAIRGDVIYYIKNDNVFSYDVNIKEESLFLENGNIKFLLFKDSNTLKYYTTDAYIENIYDFEKNRHINIENTVSTKESNIGGSINETSGKENLKASAYYYRRFDAPSTDNPYYKHVSYGGLNECIHRSGGSVLPNCVGYAWGRSYENLGSRPSLSTGNAENWFYYYSDGYERGDRGDLPALGAVAVWANGKIGNAEDGLGHVAVVEYIDGDSAIISESGYSSFYFRLSEKRVSDINFGGGPGETFLGFIYVCGRNRTPAPPSAVLSVGRSKYNVGDNVVFTFGGYNNGQHTIAIYKDSKRIDTVTVNGNTYTRKIDDAGVYSAYATSYNDYTYADSNWVEWTVNELTANLSVDNSRILANDSITFTFGGDNIGTHAKGEFALAVYRDNVKVDTIAVKDTSYTKTFATPGSYKAYMTAYSETKFKDSNWVYWTVNDLTAKLSINETEIPQNKSITFKIGGDNLGTYKNGESTLGIYKDGVRIDTVKVYGVSYTKKFTETGSYKAYVTTYSSTNYKDSSYVYWTVRPSSYIVQYDANGGSGAPSNQTKIYDETLYLSQTKPIRPGYTFKGWNTKASGSGISYNPGEKYTLNDSITLYAIWERNLLFIDVPSTHWAYSSIAYCYDKGLMSGTSPTTFNPSGTMTRAALVSVLYRLEGSPAVSGNAGFSDVAEGAWYADAVAWASQNGIVSGKGDGRFAPTDPVTRASFATILYNYAEHLGMDVSKRAGLSFFADEASVPGWAKPYIQWAVAEGLLSGVTSGNSVLVNFNGKATRAQGAVLLQKFCIM